jgi:indolepyruvate ferredoxin oxidoreductase
VLAERGTVFMSGIQALTRIPIEQLQVDRRAGHNTAAFASGYPGSPLGGFDEAMARAAKLVPHLPIVCRPAVNEEYGATAVMGSQLAAARPDRRYDGVVGLWYGKAPGADRALDALRHAVYAGTSKLGGALAIVGDDPLAKSSTLPSSSAGVFSDLNVPMLYPGDPGEALDLGRHAVALSRYSGLWVALKIVADVADGTASVPVDIDRVQPIIPDIGLSHDQLPEGRLLTPLTLELEQELVEVRVELAKAYARANRLNNVTVNGPSPWIGIVASGITYRELRSAFARLGFESDADIASLGVRLVDVRMPLPFNPEVARAFARDLEEVFIVEEKQPTIELLLKDALYAVPDRPTVVGKIDETGAFLMRAHGALDADAILPALRARLERKVGHRLPPPPPPPRTRIELQSVTRSPYFCSGCPHNRSTEVPAGSAVGAGIGCHTMTLLMDPTRVGDIVGLTPMGNEGTQWIGMADFVDTDHLIQNLGDGTYFHSGQLAITAAVAAGVNITYKLLYNGTVAMTGGQDPQGQLGVADVVRVLQAQGVAEVLITTDDRSRYRGVRFDRPVQVWDRDRVVEAQERLAKVPGVTVLIHDQRCAAELRRDRKRNRVATPTQRIAINHRICEGCGDCGQVSNCLSVQPVDTPYGRKTEIDQATCNLDASCLEGDCPSFITVETKPTRWQRAAARLGTRRRASSSGRGAADVDALLARPLPEPVPIVPKDDVAIRITGSGGTGVVTVAQVLGTAAMLDGFSVRGLDQIGLSQKAGPVVSDVHLTKAHDSITNRLGSAEADVLLAFDQLVAASEKGRLAAAPGHTVVIGSTTPTPTGAMILHPELGYPSPDELDQLLADVTRAGHRYWADAGAVTTAAFGDAIGANLLVVGMAVQAGAIPVLPEQIEAAVALNGVAVEVNTKAFRLGRHLVADRAAVDATLARPAAGGVIAEPARLDTGLRERVQAIAAGQPLLEATIVRCADDLVGYQGRKLAARYLDELERVAERERAVSPASAVLTETVATGLHKLLAYKDEYEVARLLLDPDGRREAERIAGPSGVIQYRLHPPVFRAMGMDRKITLGPWSDPVFRVLAKGRRLRGTKLDPFGLAKVRRVERRLPVAYLDALHAALPHLRADNLLAMVELADLPDLVRGYEDLKLERAGRFRDELARRVAAITG